MGRIGLGINLGVTALMLLLLIGPIRHTFVNHPYEYIYFNELVGGTKKQLGQYELDYYYHSTREASEWILAHAEPKADGSKIRVGTWHTASVNYFFRNDTAQFQPLFIRWYEKENTDWDYAIFTVSGMSPEYLRGTHFPPKNTVKTIEVDGVPIALVLKREDKSDCAAHALKSQPDMADSVVYLYHQALKVDPDNMGALYGLGETYVRIQEPDSAIYYLNRYFKIDPGSESARLMYAYALALKCDILGARNKLSQLQKYNPKFAGAYILAINIDLQNRNFRSARQQFDKVFDYEIFNDQFQIQWMQYCSMQNIDQFNAYVLLYQKIAESYERRGKKAEAQRYLDFLNEMR